MRATFNIAYGEAYDAEYKEKVSEECIALLDGLTNETDSENPREGMDEREGMDNREGIDESVRNEDEADIDFEDATDPDRAHAQEGPSSEGTQAERLRVEG